MLHNLVDNPELAPYECGQAMAGKAGDDSRQISSIRFEHWAGQVVTPQLGKFSFGNIVIRQQADLPRGPG